MLISNLIKVWHLWMFGQTAWFLSSSEVCRGWVMYCTFYHFLVFCCYWQPQWLRSNEERLLLGLWWVLVHSLSSKNLLTKKVFSKGMTCLWMVSSEQTPFQVSPSWTSVMFVRQSICQGVLVCANTATLNCHEFFFSLCCTK